MNQETKVGLFLLASAAVLLPAILFIGNINLFQRSTTYYVDFIDVEALPPKAAVKTAGVEIGKVAGIELINGHARVEIAIDPELVVYDDAVASIGSTGIIGTRFVDLIPGTSGGLPLKSGAVIRGGEGASLNKMVAKLTSLFEEDKKYGNAVDNLKATMSNIRSVSDSLNHALGKRKMELEETVLNIRDLTASAKYFLGDLEEIMAEKKTEIKDTLSRINSVAVKLDGILAKIEAGEGTIGTLVSDEKTAEDVKEAITSIKDTAVSAKKVMGRFNQIHTYWNYRLRYDFRDDESRSDVGITFVPREGKFYSVGVTNVGSAPSNEKYTEYERKNRIMAVLGADFGPFTGYAGAIRSDGGVGLNFRPFWFSKDWDRRVSLDWEVSDFSRDRTVNGDRLDTAWMAAGLRIALQRWLWFGARVEDILSRPAVMGNFNIVFRDEDFSYLLGLSSVAR